MFSGRPYGGIAEGKKLFPESLRHRKGTPGKEGKFVSRPSCLWEWKAEIRKRLRGVSFPMGVGPFHMIGRHGLRAYIAVK